MKRSRSCMHVYYVVLSVTHICGMPYTNQQESSLGEVILSTLPLAIEFLQTILLCLNVRVTSSYVSHYLWWHIMAFWCCLSKLHLRIITFRFYYQVGTSQKYQTHSNACSLPMSPDSQLVSSTLYGTWELMPWSLSIENWELHDHWIFHI